MNKKYIFNKILVTFRHPLLCLWKNKGIYCNCSLWYPRADWYTQAMHMDKTDNVIEYPSGSTVTMGKVSER